MSSRPATVLLVHAEPRNLRRVRTFFEKRGCSIFVAASIAEALRSLQERRFDLVLCEFMLPDGTVYKLVPPLRGTRTTMFFSSAVEDGCWWLQAIHKGEDKSSRPGLRPAQFAELLEEILLDIASASANEEEFSAETGSPAARKRRRPKAVFCDAEWKRD